MIVSVHMPKAGGSTFKNVLQKKYGGSMQLDYDNPMSKSFEERTNEAIKFDEKLNSLKRISYRIRGIKCIHGHFLPYKYKKMLPNKDVIFVTWLRDPVERLISHYYFWKRIYSKDSSPFHRKIVEESWSVEQFCLCDEMKNFYSNFFWEFPIDNFDFIGLVEFFNEDIQYFSNEYLSNTSKVEIKTANRNNESQGLYSDKINKEVLADIKSFHYEDYQIYNYCLEMRKQRN